MRSSMFVSLSSLCSDLKLILDARENTISRLRSDIENRDSQISQNMAAIK